jgi:predicted DNA-binding transcriptional regulator AlpA
MKIKEIPMREYEFELLFKVNSNEEMNDLIDRLYEAGCDDALIGSGKSGVIGLSFTREAASAAEAFESAIKDVKKAIPTASLMEAKPDFVGVSDIAETIGCSRQNVLKIFASTEAPMPIHSGNTSLWHLSEALKWLNEGKRAERYNIPEWKIDVATIAKEINFAVEAMHMPTHTSIRKLLA